MPVFCILCVFVIRSHVLEPEYVGAVERIVNIGSSVDYDGILSDREDIIALTDQNKAIHKRVARYLNAAGALIKDNYILELDAVDCEKITRCATRIAHREFPKSEENAASEAVRFLSAVTPKGMITLDGTIDYYADKIYNICNENGAVSRIFMSVMRKLCLKNGLGIISCPCPLSHSEKIDHIIIPSLRLAFTTSNKYHSRTKNVYRNIHTSRFCDSNLIALSKEKIAFNHRATDEIINEAILIMQQAKVIHDEIEVLYGKHIEYKEVNSVTEEVVTQIQNILSANCADV